MKKNKTVKVLKKIDGLIGQLDDGAKSFDEQAIGLEKVNAKIWSGYGKFMSRCTLLRTRLDRIIQELDIVVQKKHQLLCEKSKKLAEQQTDLLEEKERALRVSEKLKSIVK